MGLLRVSVTGGRWQGLPYTVVTPSGEADLTTVGPLRQALMSQVQLRAQRLIVDLSALSFLDSAALRTVLQAAQAATERGR